MAYNYNKYKSTYDSLTDAQRKQWDTKYGNTASYQQFMNDYQKETGNTVYTPATTQKTTVNTGVSTYNPTTWYYEPVNNNKTSTYTYGDTGGASNANKYTGTGVSSAGNYTYNPNITTNSFNNSAFSFGNNAVSQEKNNPWYLEQRNNYIANALYNEWKTDEQAIRNYLNTFDDYRAYDTIGQNNTVQAILNRMWALQSQAWGNTAPTGTGNNAWMNEVMNNYSEAKKWYSELMWWGANYYGNYWDAVNGVLSKAYWIQDLDEFKERYPSQYESLQQALSSVEWVWNATDPNERQMLEWYLQGIIWTWVGAGSDISKLWVLEESILNKFKNPDQIKQDAQNVIKLQTEWKNIGEIAEQMNMSEDQVQQLVLLANGLDSKAWEYYQLKEDVAKDITEPYDTKMERLEQEKQIVLDRANRNLEWLKDDFDTTMDRQKKQNEINAHNADAISGQYGFWFSKRGIEWLNYIADQAQQIIDDLTKNYDRNKIEMADGIADIIRNWQWNNEDLMKASQEALTNAKNTFTSNMLAIQQQYWTVWLQAQQYLAQNVQSFIEQAQNIYDNALTRQQQNLSNLITNVSNLNALAYEDLTLRSAKIQQFQSESMNLNRNQLQNLASQLWIDTESYQDLVNYQMQAVANELNGYLPWAWVQFQSQIQSLLDSWYTPAQAINSIMNSQEFKAMQQALAGTWSNWAVSGWVLYNKATGEYQNINTASNERWSAGSGTIYNKSTWEVKTTTGKTVSTTNSNWGYQQVKLTDEQPNVDTGIKNVYGSNVKLTPTVWGMLNEAYNKLLAQWIELKIWDSYRSYATQKQAYESWKAWVVSPDKSFHCLWQAFDVVQDGSMYTDEVVQALLDAGFTRPNAKEPRHWSYGEWSDAFWGKPRNTNAYDMAEAILSWVWTLPAKNSKEYSDTVVALNDLVQKKRWNSYPEWIELINYSIINDANLSDTLSTTISSTMSSIYSTDTLMELLKKNNYKTWPIISKLAKLNPRDADYASLEASINQMASNIARWFWEKWVLTDKDIERYMKTIPNEKMGNKSQEVVGTLLKAKLYDWLVRTLEAQAKNKKDVSMYASEYKEAIDWLVKNGFRTKWTGSSRWLTGSTNINLQNRGR